MIRQLTRALRLVAGATSLALAVGSSATCFAATLQMPDAQQHACCAAMADCSSAKTTVQDCCVARSPAFAGLVPIVASNLATPSMVLMSMIAADVLAPRPQSAAFNPDISPPSGTPPYLLDSVFRL